MNWVATYGDRIRHVFKSGQDLLELCQRKNDQQRQSHPDVEEVDAIRDGKVRMTVQEYHIPELMLPIQQDEDYSEHDYGERNYGDYNYDDDGYEPMKDLTACDKECGYCGNCDYQYLARNK